MMPQIHRLIWILVVAAPLVLCAADPVSYDRQIRPILVRQCEGCHQSLSKQSGLLLTSYGEFQKGGQKGAAFAPGDPDKSVVISYLTGKIKPQMPYGGRPLPDDQIELFQRWIREGARDDSPVTSATGAGKLKETVYSRPPLVTALRFSPDGKMLAVSGYHEILLHTSEGELLARLPGLAMRIHSLAFSADGATLVAAGGDPARFGELQIWDVAARKQRHSVVLSNDTLFGASLSPDGSKIAAGAADKSIRLFDAASGKEIRKIDHHEEWVFGTAFALDGKRLVSVSRDRAAKLTDASTGAFIENVNLLKEGLTALARHPKKDWILIGGQQRIPYLYRLDRPRAMRIADDSTLIRAFPLQDGPILALAFSPDGQQIAVGAEAGDVRIYNAETGELAARCSGQEGGVYAIEFHPDGKRVATAGFDGTVRFYNLDGTLAKSFVPVPITSAALAGKAQP